ncbi:hypothetical protein [Embleya sp. AB8]|uniref:hypothetical protein n=1 Tax=Embleya sp. AB8 TaxID=3156304 RepID=UPI003C77AA1E
MTTRNFTRDELAHHGVPPYNPEDIQFSQSIRHDEQITILKYSQLRLVVFVCDDDHKTYAVEYESPIDVGDHEVGYGPDDHGWRGKTIEGTEVRLRPVVVDRWVTVTPGDEHHRGGTALHQLTELYEECGVAEHYARQHAAELLAKHAAELRG